MSETRMYARLVRRETHHSRSTAVSVALIVSAIAVGYFGTESVLAALGQPALLLTPGQMIAAVRTSSVGSISVSVALAVLGVAAVISVLTRGRRSRHRLDDTRMAVVVDDDVLAGAISRQVALNGSVDRRRARTVVARRRATVRLTPHSGYPVDGTAAAESAAAAVEQLNPRPPMRTRVFVAEKGVLS